jgi:hypothetical protein
MSALALRAHSMDMLAQIHESTGGGADSWLVLTAD